VSRPIVRSSQACIQLVLGTASLGVKRQGLEVDHSPLSKSEVKKSRRYIYIPSQVFMALCFIKRNDNYMFLIILHPPCAQNCFRKAYFNTSRSHWHFFLYLRSGLCLRDFPPKIHTSVYLRNIISLGDEAS
jgi:hypothetical protein